MPLEAMTQSSDSQNPSAPPPRPGRRVYWLTKAALEELENERNDQLHIRELEEALYELDAPPSDDYGGF